MIAGKEQKIVGQKKGVLVTGAGSGIGQATALECARKGYRVAILGRAVPKLQSTRELLQEYTDDTLLLQADVSDAAQMQDVYNRIDSSWGHLDAVVANAGINGVWAPLEHMEPEEWDDTIRINLRGTFLTVKYAIPFLKKSKGGIVITSSELGTRVFTRYGCTAYCSTKAAQVAFGKQQAVELAQFKIRVNTVCPGWIDTDITVTQTFKNTDYFKQWVEYPYGVIPLTDGELPSPDCVAKVIAFLLSEDASHITGTEVYIDGGESLVL